MFLCEETNYCDFDNGDVLLGMKWKDSKDDDSMLQKPWVRVFFFIAPASIDRGHTVFGLSFCLSTKNFYIGHSFWMVGDKAIIFHMIIPCDKTFLLVLNSRS